MAACVLGLLAAGCALAIVTLAARGGSDPSFGIGTARDWRDGSQMQRIDRAIDVPYAHWLHRWQAALRYRLLGDLGPQVREGCPGWLFYADGLRPPPESAATQPVDAVLNARIAAMHRYAHALRRDGIALVVVTVPDKARVETQALCGLRQDPRIGQRLRAWQSALTQAGVAHVELTGALSAVRPAFYRTDVHWNARGAQAAARAVGDAVLPLVGGRGDTRFTLERGAAEQPRVGDLLALAGLGDVPDGWRPPPDDDVQETLHAERAGGLLDDGPPVQVLLAGSSFSRRSAFADRLGEALGREVWNESVDDGRFDRALAAMWTRRARWPASLRAVIWEMSEDALSAPPDAPTVMRSTAAAPAPGVTPGPAARPSAAPADAPRPRLLLSN